MSTTRIFGTNPFEVYLKPTNKIQIKMSANSTDFKAGTVVAWDGNGNLVRANANDRTRSSVLGIVTDTSGGYYTIVTQGVIENVTPEGMGGAGNGDIWFLSTSAPGTLQESAPIALGTTRIAVAQKLSDTSFYVLGIPGIVNGIAYRGYVNIAAIQPVGTVSPFIGDSSAVPKNWLLCDGSYVSIDLYPDLYRLIGSIYGEVLDGRFKLPDFRGRTLIGAGQGDKLSQRFIGEFGGEEQHSLTIQEMPAHAHRPEVGPNTGVDHWWGSDNRVGSPNFDYDGTSTTAKPSDGFIAPSYKTNTVGGNSPHNNMSPYSVANWIIRAKAESEFALLDVNVESLTNVEKGRTASTGDSIRFDGTRWNFVKQSLANATDLTVAPDVATNDLVTAVVNGGDVTFKTVAPSGSNISFPGATSGISLPLVHKNGSPRPTPAEVELGTISAVPIGRKGMIHINGTLEIEPTNGSVDGTVNVNLIGYSGTNGLTEFDTLTIPHYVQGGIRSMKIPFHATVAAQTFGGSGKTKYKFSYYLSTATGSQFKANVLTIDNVKFVY